MPTALFLAKLSLLGVLATFLPLFAGLRRRRHALAAGLVAFTILLGGSTLMFVAADRPGLARHWLLLGGGAVVGLALLAGLTWLAWRYPRWAVPAMIVVMPLRVPLSAAGSSANLLVPLYLTALAILLAEVVLRDRLRWPDDLPRDPARYALAAVIAVAGVTTLWVGLHYAAHDAAFAASLTKLFAFFLPFAVVYYLVYRYLARREDLYRLVFALLGSGAVLAVVGLVQYPTRWTFINRAKILREAQIEHVYRINSLFWDPNMCGRFMVVVAVLAAAAALALPGTRRRWLPAGVAALAAAALLLTFSRSSWLALSTAAILFEFVWLGRRKGLVVASLTVALLLGGFVAYTQLRSPGATERKLETLYGWNKLSGGRAYLVRGGWKMFERHPEGIGFGGFPLAYPDYRQYHLVRGEKRPLGAKDLTESHTTAMTILAEQGVEGIAAFVALLVAYFATALRSAGLREDRRLRLLQGGFMAVVLAILLHSFFYNAFFEDPYLWTVMAASMAIRCRLARRPAPEMESAGAPV